MPRTGIKSKLQFWAYRLSTICKSLKILYTLPPEKINAFLDSYDMYDHDWVNEDQLLQKMGSDYYNKIKKKIVDYYSVLNHLCSIGQVEKMYIPPAMDLSKSIIANQALFEERMSRDLGLRKGSQVLDVGCGRGRVANHIASITGANVTGINIDHDQLKSAEAFAKGNGLSEQCQFKRGDLNEIPFPFAANSLDAIYQIQVFTYSKNLEKLFADLYRMLKPGAKLACLDWVRLPNYNPSDARHVDLMQRIKPLIGAIGTPSADEYVDSMKKAGFKILVNENASIDGLQAPLIENADKFFTRVTRAVQFLVRWRLLPRHFQTLFDRLTKDGQAFVEADRERLVTTSHYIVAQKP
ncbi:MAG TPA: class I SAM-dependent methyltransferase [Chlamydiales bacterium]|nr:class I SAM-dependent methyltransferase [Chlamydiales bacterium]